MTDLAVLLDIDGVGNAYYTPSHGLLGIRQWHALTNLIETLIERDYNPRIWLNSSWSSVWNRPLKKEKPLAERFRDAGFGHVDRIEGTTGCSGGGGDPVRRWLITNDWLHKPFVILEDEPSRRFEELWARMVWINGRIGFRLADIQRVLNTLDPSVSDGEKIRLKLQARKAHFLAADWLTPEQKREALASVEALASKASDPNFNMVAEICRKECQK